MAKPQSEAVAASLLTSWTDADTAMQIVGTSIGVFGDGPLDPTVVLSTETPLRNALFDVLLSLVEGGAVEMRFTGDDRYAFRWRNDIAVAGVAPNGSSAIDLAVPSPYLAELHHAHTERDAALRRAVSAEALADDREQQLQQVAEAAPAKIPPKPAARKGAPMKAAPKPAEAPKRQAVKAEPVEPGAAKATRQAATKKAAPKKAVAESQEVLYLAPPDVGPEPDIDLTLEETRAATGTEATAEPTPRRPKWAGYAIDRSRQHLSSVDHLADDA